VLVLEPTYLVYGQAHHFISPIGESPLKLTPSPPPEALNATSWRCSRCDFGQSIKVADPTTMWQPCVYDFTGRSAGCPPVVPTHRRSGRWDKRAIDQLLDEVLTPSRVRPVASNSSPVLSRKSMLETDRVSPQERGLRFLLGVVGHGLRRDTIFEHASLHLQTC
jgi:hypothetical protein